MVSLRTRAVDAPAHFGSLQPTWPLLLLHCQQEPSAPQRSGQLKTLQLGLQLHLPGWQELEEHMDSCELLETHHSHFPLRSDQYSTKVLLW